MNKEIKKNFIFAIMAQAISLLVSCVTNLILPKILNVDAFSYWQLFIFYSAYIPCLALGLNDGIYMRYGGAHIDKINFSNIKSQYFVGQFVQFILGLIVGFIFILNSKTADRRLILCLVILYFFVFTARNFLGYLYQAVNQTNIYSKSVMIERFVFFIGQIALMLFLVKSVYFYILFYIIGVAMAFVYLRLKLLPYFREAYFNLRLGIIEGWASMRAGISLMIANICSMLVLGVGRQIIDIRWGLIAFGKISFSLTLMNFALTFIMQIGLVLFPALRRLKFNDLKDRYAKFTLQLFYILPLMYIAYIPAQFILKLWLPKYTTSIDYLALVLPICYFDSKMELIGNTFFKVMNKQVLLLKLNVITIIVSSALGLVSAYLFNRMEFVIIGMVLSIIFRSLLADFFLNKYIPVHILAFDALDVLLAEVFVLACHYLQWWNALIYVLIVYGIRFILTKTRAISL